jgi:hypothetical protein
MDNIRGKLMLEKWLGLLNFTFFNFTLKVK